TDAVPTSARFYGGEVLVALLSGDPFGIASAGVEIVNPETREIRQLIPMLTTVTDILYRDTSAGPQFFVCEYRSSLVGMPNSGRVLQFDSAQGKVIADQLQGPTGLAQDPVSGDIFIAENRGGRITRIRLQCRDCGFDGCRLTICSVLAAAFCTTSETS